MNDLRFAFRQLLRNRGFATVAVLTLAVGIGVTTTVFSLVNSVLLRPLPYPEGETLVEVKGPLSIPNFIDWQKQQNVFEHLCLYRAANYNVLPAGGTASQVLGIQLSASSFPALGLTPLLGRFFTEAEDTVGGPRVAVLSEPYWRRNFGGDPGVVGRTLSLDGVSYAVVGVMPAQFELVAGASVIVPAEPAVAANDRNNRKNQPSYEAFARLKPGVSVEAAGAAMRNIHTRLGEQYPESNKEWSMTVRPLLESRVGEIRATLWILLGAVLLVLVVACANVASLFMVRCTARMGEMAVRLALGADRRRIIRQLLTESVLLSMIAAAIGLLLAHWGIALARTLVSDMIPRAAEAGLDVRVLLVTVSASLLTGVLFGLFPVWQTRGADQSVTLKEAGRGLAGGGGAVRVLRGLMVGQVALSLILLFGAGLLLRSFQRLSRVDAGYRHEQAVSFRLDLSSGKFSSPDAVDQFSQEFLGRLRALAGVNSASLATGIPIDGRSWVTPLSVEGRPDNGASSSAMEVNVVDADYFKVMGIPVLKGRAFTEWDSRAAQSGPADGKPDFMGLRSIILDEEFARRHFPGQDPLGKQIRLPWGEREQNPVLTVVGVVGRVKREALREDGAKILPMGYLAYRERPNRHIAVIARTTLPFDSFVRSAREQLAAIEPGMPLYGEQTLSGMRDANMARDRLSMVLLAISAGIALALAIVGVYGVVSFSVAQRQREIAVRMALGAQRRDVLNLVFRLGMKFVLVGTVAGLAGAFGFGHVLAGFLFQVAPGDPATLGTVSAILFGTAALACVVPAVHASRLDPMTLLRR